MLPKYLDHYSHGARVWPAVAAAVIAALLLLSSLALPGCASQGLVDAETAADKVTVGLGDAAVLLGVRVDDVMGMMRVGDLTAEEADVKLAQIRRWQIDLEEAKALVDAGNLAAGDRSIAAVKAFLLELGKYLTDKGLLRGG